MLSKTIVSLCLSLVVTGTSFGATVAFDYIKTPADTLNSGFAGSFTDLASVGVGYSTAATRHTFAQDSFGVSLSVVVYGAAPDTVTPLPPVDFAQVEHWIEVWDSNPGIGSAVFAQEGNIRHSMAPVSIVNVDYNTPWSSVSGGGLPTYVVELDISDTFFEGGTEYWLAALVLRGDGD